MTTTQAKVSVIAKHSTKGAYDFARDTKIVRRGDEVFLVADEWCGDNLGGYCYRPFVYLIPAAAVAAATRDLAEENFTFHDAMEPGEVDGVTFFTAGGKVYGHKVSAKPYPRGYKSVYAAK